MISLRNKTLFFAAFVLISSLLFLPKINAKNKKELLDKKKQDISKIKKEISEKEKLIKKLKSKETSILSVISGIDGQIGSGKKRVKKIDKEKKEVSKKISNIHVDIGKLKEKVKLKEKAIKDRLRTSYKMGRYGFLEILLSSENYSDFQRKRYYLETLVKNEKEMLKDYLSVKVAVESKLNDLQEKEDTLREYSREARENLSNIKKNKTKRVAVLRAVRSEKALELKKAKELTRAAKNLESMMQRIMRSAAGGKDDFMIYKGELKIPVRGKLARGFGAYNNKKLNVKMYSKGLEYNLDKNSKVKSIADGSVIFAGPFRGYGNMIIVDHGSGYYSLYSRMNSLSKNNGDAIKQGDVLGAAGGEDHIFGSDFYFELRHNGIPENPKPWFSGL